MKIIEKVICYSVLDSWMCYYQGGAKEEIDADLARILIMQNDYKKRGVGLVNSEYVFIQPAKVI